jgi:hypothetical protein
MGVLEQDGFVINWSSKPLPSRDIDRLDAGCAAQHVLTEQVTVFSGHLDDLLEYKAS